MTHNILQALVRQEFPAVADHPAFGVDADIYELGVTSLQTVSLMLAIEDCFGFQFPASELSREAFRSVNAMAVVVDRLRVREAAAQGSA